jgi:glyoxylase-like metal-dependent hydrolase (beta-lactamase superfamily II)
VDVAEVAPGLWRWTGYHAEWEEDVGSVYCETPYGVVLIDPLVPPDGGDRFWRALDRDVKRAGGDVHVLVTVFWHTRDAAKMVDRYSARVWAPSRGRAAIERRSGTVTDVFSAGDPLPGGLEARPTVRGAEVVFWLPEHGALVPGDVLLGAGAKGGGTRSTRLRMCPESWLPEKATHAKLAESLRPLLDLPLRRILVSHGRPVVRGAQKELAAALDAGAP